jgi:hypothetical protein
LALITIIASKITRCIDGPGNGNCIDDVINGIESALMVKVIEAEKMSSMGGSLRIYPKA